MAYPATKRISYWGQLGILAAFTGAGLVVGGIVSLIPLAGKIDLKDFQGLSAKDMMNSLFVPENANLLRWVQFLTTLFLFLPPVFMLALLKRHLLFVLKIRYSAQFLIVILIMIAALHW